MTVDMENEIFFNSSVSTSDETVNLPIFVSYLILIFRIVSTVYVTAVGIAVILTVARNNSNVKGPQVLFIINLMLSGTVSAANATLQSSVMIISYIIGKEDYVRCDLLFITLSTFHVNAFAFFLLAIDKVIAVMFPYKYKSKLANKLAFVIIFISWALSFFISIVRLHMHETYTKSSQYGVCIPHHDSFVSLLVNFVAPIFLSFVFALSIDIYISVLAYKMKKRIQHGANRSHNTEYQVKLRQRLRMIAASSISPIVAVLIGIVSHSLLGFLCPLLFITTQTVDTNKTYKFLVEYIVIPNAAYCFLVSYSIVYNVYFRNIRELTYMVVKLMAIIVCSCVMRCVRCRCIKKRNIQIFPMSRPEEVESTSRSEEEDTSRPEEVEFENTSRPEEVEDTSRPEAEDTV